MCEFRRYNGNSDLPERAWAFYYDGPYTDPVPWMHKATTQPKWGTNSLVVLSKLGEAVEVFCGNWVVYADGGWDFLSTEQFRKAYLPENRSMDQVPQEYWEDCGKLNRCTKLMPTHYHYHKWDGQVHKMPYWLVQAVVAGTCIIYSPSGDMAVGGGQTAKLGAILVTSDYGTTISALSEEYFNTSFKVNP